MERFTIKRAFPDEEKSPQPVMRRKAGSLGERKQRFAEIGEGNLNWPSIIEKAQSVGVEWFLVEQDDCYERDPFDSLAISYRNLSRIGLK